MRIRSIELVRCNAGVSSSALEDDKSVEQQTRYGSSVLYGKPAESRRSDLNTPRRHDGGRR